MTGEPPGAGKLPGTAGRPANTRDGSQSKLIAPALAKLIAHILLRRAEIDVSKRESAAFVLRKT
jgi:hypothetical protein